jgi:hypothetical protein
MKQHEKPNLLGMQIKSHVKDDARKVIFLKLFPKANFIPFLQIA